MAFINDAVVLRVVDADTLSVLVDLGWSVHIEGHVRLLGVSAPERNTEKGKWASQFVEGLIATQGPQITVVTYKRDPARTFTRYLADVLLSDGRNLAEVIIEEGYGTRTAG